MYSSTMGNECTAVSGPHQCNSSMFIHTKHLVHSLYSLFHVERMSTATQDWC